jgi:hypothetical protein
MHMSFIALVIEAVRTSETSVNFKVTTRRYVLEDLNFRKVLFWLRNVVALFSSCREEPGKHCILGYEPSPHNF